MIVATMISLILFTTLNNFRVIIPGNIFQARRKVWNGNNQPTKAIIIETEFLENNCIGGLTCGQP